MKLMIGLLSFLWFWLDDLRFFRIYVVKILFLSSLNITDITIMDGYLFQIVIKKYFRYLYSADCFCIFYKWKLDVSDLFSDVDQVQLISIHLQNLQWLFLSIIYILHFKVSRLKVWRGRGGCHHYQYCQYHQDTKLVNRQIPPG